MTITLDHVLVPSRDKRRSARFLADLLGLEVGDRSAGSPPGRFAVVRVGTVSFDFDDVEQFDPHHYAFAVDDEAFDRILGQVTDAGLPYSADPRHRRIGQLNDWNGGRGFYVRDPDGHNLEFLTRP